MYESCAVSEFKATCNEHGSGPSSREWVLQYKQANTLAQSYCTALIARRAFPCIGKCTRWTPSHFRHNWTCSVAFNPHLGLSHCIWTAAICLMRFQQFNCSPVPAFANHCLLQKITATATAPSDAQKSNMARAHNAGAAALVMHRGQENCKSSLSVGLLFSVRSQLVSTDPSQD